MHLESPKYYLLPVKHHLNFNPSIHSNRDSFWIMFSGISLWTIQISPLAVLLSLDHKVILSHNLTSWHYNLWMMSVTADRSNSWTWQDFNPFMEVIEWTQRQEYPNDKLDPFVYNLQSKASIMHSTHTDWSSGYTIRKWPNVQKSTLVNVLLWLILHCLSDFPCYCLTERLVTYRLTKLD